MDDNGGCLVCFLVLVAAIFITAGLTDLINDSLWQSQLVERGLAEYDSQTGAWKWKEPNPQPKE